MSKFRYNIRMTYINNDTEYIIDNKYIHHLAIDYDYINKNRPILFSHISVDKNLLDTMIKGKSKDKIILTINKIDNMDDFKIERTYIKEAYIYFLQDDLNTDKVLDYSHDKDSDDRFKNITIGMINKKLIDMNKCVMNGVIMNTSLNTILLYHLQNNNLLIEPVNDVMLDNFIIPPLSSLTDLIDYINDYYPIYNTKYINFFDNNITYMISSSGNGVISKDDHINSVILDVKDTTDIESKNEGMYIDNTHNTYIVNIDSSDIDMYKIDNSISHNTIIGIDSDGNINKQNIMNDNLDKAIIERFNNINTVDIMKNDMIVDTMMNITKSELDSSVFTPNKQYIIKSYNNLKDYSGTYILVRKRDIFIRQENDFILNNIFTFKKIVPST
ncbi:MAG: hypothetical protein ACRCXT_11010 [Paraclostridium sp.]